jgi:hypothetical protein
MKRCSDHTRAGYPPPIQSTLPIERTTAPTDQNDAPRERKSVTCKRQSLPRERVWQLRNRA